MIPKNETKMFKKVGNSLGNFRKLAGNSLGNIRKLEIQRMARVKVLWFLIRKLFSKHQETSGVY